MATQQTLGSPATVAPSPILYWSLWLVGAALIAVPLIIAVLAWNSSFLPYFGLGPTLLLAAFFYLAFSLKIVRENEVGAAFSYGKPLVALASGLHLMPYGLMQLRTGPRSVEQFQCPGDPEKTFKGDDTETLPAGMVRAIRVVTGGPQQSHSTDDTLNTRMTITLSFWVQWAVVDVLLYASNYGSVEKVQHQVRDIAESVLAEIAVGHSPASFIDALPKVNKLLTKRVGERFANSGVNIIATRQISPDVSHGVSKALAGIPIASATAKQVKIAATAEKAKRALEGEGSAAAELALLNARAAGQKKMKDELAVSGDAVLAAQAVRELSTKTDVLVVGAEGGMKDVMGLVKGAQSAFNSSKGA